MTGRHFAAALLFLIAGAGGLAWRAPALAAGAFSDPGVIASVHLITLGWLSTSLMGGLYRFLPELVGAAVRWKRLADVTFALWTAGLALFAWGTATSAPRAHLAGAAGLGLAALLFGANLSATLARAPRRGTAWWCLAGATLSLVGAWVLGMLLGVNLTGGLLGASRYAVLLVHVHIAAGGWVLLTLIGASHRRMTVLLPADAAVARAGQVAAGLVAAGTGMLLLSEHLLPVGVLRPALGVQAAGAAVFLLQGALFFLSPHRPATDPGERIVAASLGLLGLALLAGLAALLGARDGPRVLTAYGLLLVPGGLSLFVAGGYCLAVPSPAGGRAPGTLLTGGVLALAAGALLGREALCLAGGIGLATGALTLGLQTVGVTRGGLTP